ncbi:MAG: hypothetical protein ACW97A_03930 [Candidatus Thorarchaeota archaeon]|jgi:hypothetical protein
MSDRVNEPYSSDMESETRRLMEAALSRISSDGCEVESTDSQFITMPEYTGPEDCEDYEQEGR